MFIKTLAAAAATLALASAAHASTIVQWNFNSTTPDANTGTGTTAPASGAGVATAIGGVTTLFNGGSTSDTTSATDNSGWGLTTFAAQASGNKSRGAQFMFSTVGLQDVVFNFDLRHSNTSAANEVVQYTVDGSTFIDFVSFTATAGDTWFTRAVDFSAISAADNNANFGVRVVAGFGSAGSYVAAKSGSSYGTTGTWRFDQVSATGTTVPVPEPETYALMLAGLGVLGLVRRAKR